MRKATELVIGKKYYDSEFEDSYLVISRNLYTKVVTVKFDRHNLTETFPFDDLIKDAYIGDPKQLVVPIKALNTDAIVPEYKTEGAVGFDLHITEDITVPANRVVINFGNNIKVDPDDYSIDVNSLDVALTNDNHAVAGTGLAFEIPIGHELEIRSRSGLAFKHQVMAYNGTIDSDYRSEVKLLITNLGKEPIHFKKGDRVAQGIIKKIDQAVFAETDTLSETERGSGGFGSTGLSK